MIMKPLDAAILKFSISDEQDEARMRELTEWCDDNLDKVSYIVNGKHVHNVNIPNICASHPPQRFGFAIIFWNDDTYVMFKMRFGGLL